MKKAILALADGTIFEGVSFGATGEAIGEVVFNTSMAGYQEILTDPSYVGQIVTMTYPLIGNYGINEADFESVSPKVAGFIIKELSHIPSNWRSQMRLEEFLAEHHIVGIQGIDTRALTRHIRDAGAQTGIISSEDTNPQSLIDKARAAPGLVGRDLVKEVTCPESYRWNEGCWNWQVNRQAPPGAPTAHFYPASPPKTRFKVAVYDYGIKHNILRSLVSAGCEAIVYPAHTPAEQVLGCAPDGIFLSNGPGDPAGVPYAIENVKKLLGKKPIFGICLGHQILGLALGYNTYKLKFGHHGANHPVMQLSSGKVEITAQNHGFAVDIPGDRRPDSPLVLTHINLNDQTVEGMEHQELPLFSVQYHPEASPGPHDASYLFHKFTAMMEKWNG
jgi:carbamoyl-phosphate synthase small subunit